MREALQKWNYQQKIESEELHLLSHAMGTHMVIQPPDWPNMNPKKMLEWWLKKIIGNKSWYITNTTHKPAEQKETDNPESFIQAKL